MPLRRRVCVFATDSELSSKSTSNHRSPSRRLIRSIAIAQLCHVVARSRSSYSSCHSSR